MRAWDWLATGHRQETRATTKRPLPVRAPTLARGLSDDVVDAVPPSTRPGAPGWHWLEEQGYEVDEMVYEARPPPERATRRRPRPACACGLARRRGVRPRTSPMGGHRALTAQETNQPPPTTQDGALRREDGRAVDRPVTVGVIYMLKLAHLVQDKVHALDGPTPRRSSRCGKAQFGGQRLARWSVGARGPWRGAPQEMLTIKSDVMGRVKTYGRRQGRWSPRRASPGLSVLIKDFRRWACRWRCSTAGESAAGAPTR